MALTSTAVAKTVVELKQNSAWRMCFRSNLGTMIASTGSMPIRKWSRTLSYTAMYPTWVSVITHPVTAGTHMPVVVCFPGYIVQDSTFKTILCCSEKSCWRSDDMSNVRLIPVRLMQNVWQDVLGIRKLSTKWPWNDACYYTADHFWRVMAVMDSSNMGATISQPVGPGMTWVKGTQYTCRAQGTAFGLLNTLAGARPQLRRSCLFAAWLLAGLVAFGSLSDHSWICCKADLHTWPSWFRSRSTRIHGRWNIII